MCPSLRVLLALSLLIPAGGCCSLSRGLSALFCGPRQDPWVQISYQSPRQALDTFLGAISRDDVDVIYKSLSESLKNRLRLGSLEAEVVWKRIKAEVPGIHIADEAEISQTDQQSPTRVRYQLQLPFTALEVYLVRQDYWSVTLQLDGQEERHGRVVGSLGELVKVLANDESTPFKLEVPGPQIPGVSLEEVSEISVGREWKVADFKLLSSDPP